MSNREARRASRNRLVLNAASRFDRPFSVTDVWIQAGSASSSRQRTLPSHDDVRRYLKDLADEGLLRRIEHPSGRLKTYEWTPGNE